MALHDIQPWILFQHQNIPLFGKNLAQNMKNRVSPLEREKKEKKKSTVHTYSLQRGQERRSPPVSLGRISILISNLFQISWQFLSLSLSREGWRNFHPSPVSPEEGEEQKSHSPSSGIITFFSLSFFFLFNFSFSFFSELKNSFRDLRLLRRNLSTLLPPTSPPFRKLFFPPLPPSVFLLLKFMCFLLQKAAAFSVNQQRGEEEASDSSRRISPPFLPPFPSSFSLRRRSGDQRRRRRRRN